ncbi:MAG: Fe-S cluster assembly protein SufD [Ignavibacteria bacterium GWF2_33_9]|nr:MAG: Fe-S cluster assembly protein SufD [Ignavibacteria bacterium GWF2_33_9]
MNFKNYIENKFTELINVSPEFQNNSNIFTEIGFPTFKDENWKYTPMHFLFKNEFSLIGASVQIDKVKIIEYLEQLYIPENSIIYLLKNGELFEFETSKLDPSCLIVETENEYIKEFQIDTSKMNNNVFELLNNSFSEKKITFHLKNESVPIVILNVANDSNQFVNNNLSFLTEAYAKSEIFLYSVNTGETNFLNSKININLAENSQLKLNLVPMDEKENYTINNIEITQNNNSDLTINNFNMKSKFIRNNFQANLNGQGIESKLFGLFIGKNNSVVDNHINFDHNEPNCHSNQFFKGIIEDTSRGVFNGKIHVKKDAQKTDAYQTNRNILTSKEASIFTKPELEIYADDVKCSHGATSGFLQENELFYLMSRGLGMVESKSLLLKAFANEVIDKIEDEPFREWLRAKLDEVI